jgi:hypothetical protein
MKITKVSSNVIEGTGYDPTYAVTQQTRFAVDLMTGRSLLSLPASLAEPWSRSKKEWRTRGDLNSQPSAPEADALSI